MRDRLSVIMRHQATLMGKFRHIEEQNGFNFHGDVELGVPQNINAYGTQHELRRLAWCIQEELCEAASAMDSGTASDSKLEIQKELIDALHFICEFLLTLGYWPSDLPAEDFRRPEYVPEGLTPNLFQTMMLLGMTINELKNKPWKQTPRVTDLDKFKDQLARFMRSFIRTCYASGMTDQDIEDVYLGKNSENQERIATGV